MTPSALDQRARHLLTCLIEQTDENYIHRHIDEPIDAAVAAFSDSKIEAMDHGRFVQLMAGLWQHVAERGVATAVPSSQAQADDEVISFLVHAYRGTEADGYEAATLDARTLPDGGKVAIHQFAESLKVWRRQLHIQWVRARLIAGTTREVRNQLAAILLAELHPWLPQTFQGLQSWQFADDPQRLLQVLAETTPQALLDRFGPPQPRP